MDALRTHSFMDEDARMRLPNPDELLNVGYALHCASNKALKGTLELDLAKKSAQDFISLSVPQDTPGAYYLQSVRPVVLSHARGISRRKAEYLNKVRAANELRRQKEQQISPTRLDGRRLVGRIIGIFWKVMGPIILGLVGFLVAKVLGDIVPDAVSDKTGSFLPSAILTLVFPFGGWYISMLLYERQRARIIGECEITTLLAHEAYEEGKYYEFMLARERLGEAWLQYTGEEYPVTVSYEMVMKGDTASRKKLEQHLLVHNKTDYRRLMQFGSDVKKAVTRRLRKKRVKKPAKQQGALT